MNDCGPRPSVFAERRVMKSRTCDWAWVVVACAITFVGASVAVAAASAVGVEAVHPSDVSIAVEVFGAVFIQQAVKIVVRRPLTATR